MTDKTDRPTTTQGRWDLAPEAEFKPDWRALTLEAGARIWGHGEVADTLARIVRGSVAVWVEGQEVGRAHEGELIGEAAAFCGGRRMGDVVALSEVELSVIEREALEVMGRTDPVAYDGLLKEALDAVGARVEATNQRLAEISAGLIPAPSPRRPSSLSKLWLQVKGDAPTGAPAPVEAALASLPVGKGAHAAALALIGVALKPRALSKGEALFVEGEEGRELFLLASGELQITKAAGEDKAHELAILGIGALVGAGGFLRGMSRGATAVARSPAWVWSLDQAGYAALGGRGRRLLDELLLVMLRDQLNNVDILLSRARSGNEDPALEVILKAMGELEGWRSADVKQTMKL